MKSVLTLFATALLGLGICACGHSNKAPAPQNVSNVGAGGSASAGTGSTSSTSTHKDDRDNDGDNNNDDQHVLGFGHVAGAADNQAITTLITRYYAAAATEDGTKACPLLAPFIAESLPEGYGRTAGLRGSTCTAVISKLFKKDHRELVNKNATLKVMRVGVEGDKSLVALEFPTIPEVRQVTIRRNGNTWKMLTLLDGILE